jgi:hypothetical protein
VGYKSNQKRVRMIREGRLSTLPADLPWSSFEQAVGPDGKHFMFDGKDRFEIFRNSRYTVMRREFQVSPDHPVMIHLSLRRNDRKPVTSWRDMQKIKNELVGEECEGVQMFPAESRLVDNANQYHIFVCKDPDMRLPFGYGERLVSTGNIQGSVQEPFESHVLPDDLTDTEEIGRRMTDFKSANGVLSKE